MKKMILVGLSLIAFAGFADNKSAEAEKPLKVLMIGNSFSQSVMWEFPAIANNLGLKLDLCSLYIGGCVLSRHWSNVEKGDDLAYMPYVCDRFVDGQRTIVSMPINVTAALVLDKWDVITLQQGSHESWKKESYQPYGDNLVKYIRSINPTAKIIVQETWSYTPWDKRFAQWGIDQNEMYKKLHEAYYTFANKHKFEVIPMGTAVQRWRKEKPVKYTEKSFGGDVVGSAKFERAPDGKWIPKGDVFHLNGAGCYFQGLLWTAKIFGVDVTKCTYAPKFVSEEDAKRMRKIATELAK